MTLTFSSGAWNDYLYWQKTDQTILKRIHLLIKNIERDPFAGIGKTRTIKTQPERLLVAPNYGRTPHRL